MLEGWRPADVGGLVFIVGIVVPVSFTVWYLVAMIALATWRQWRVTGVLRLPKEI